MNHCISFASVMLNYIVQYRKRVFYELSAILITSVYKLKCLVFKLLLSVLFLRGFPRN